MRPGAPLIDTEPHVSVCAGVCHVFALADMVSGTDWEGGGEAGWLNIAPPPEGSSNASWRPTLGALRLEAFREGALLLSETGRSAAKSTGDRQVEATPE